MSTRKLCFTSLSAYVTSTALSSLSIEIQVIKLSKGALQWNSPEYIRGDRLTLASDIYAFGMCILEAVTGESPWGRLTADTSVRYHQRKGKLPLQPESLSGSQWTLIEMMCAWEPTQRVQIFFVVDKLHEFMQQHELNEKAAASALGVLNAP